MIAHYDALRDVAEDTEPGDPLPGAVRQVVQVEVVEELLLDAPPELGDRDPDDDRRRDPDEELPGGQGQQLRRVLLLLLVAGPAATVAGDEPDRVDRERDTEDGLDDGRDPPPRSLAFLGHPPEADRGLHELPAGEGEQADGQHPQHDGAERAAADFLERALLVGLLPGVPQRHAHREVRHDHVHEPVADHACPAEPLRHLAVLRTLRG
jgi:hypothetical protein